MDQSSPLETGYIDTSTVISILPVPLSDKKPGLIPGEFEIPACKDPMKECEVLHVSRATFPVYIDEYRPALRVQEPSDRLANSICRDYKVSMAFYENNVSEPGLFWVKGAVKKSEAQEVLQKELEYARRLQYEWFKRLVADADDMWEKYHMRKLISGLQKIACKHLGQERQWNLDLIVEASMGMKKCRYCFSDVHPEAIVCMACRGVLDIKRYEIEYIATK